MAVVVVYERCLEDVDAWPVLRAALSSARSNEATISVQHVLVYDNSATPRAQPDVMIAHCSYIHDNRNGGTAAAYGAAIEQAHERDIEWLLLLDQDTRLPADYFVDAAVLRGSANDTAAWLPWVSHSSTRVSPARITSSGTIRPLAPTHVRPGRRLGLTGIASGAFVRVSSLRSLGSFPPGLWLDYVDHWMFAQFRQRGMHIEILHAKLEHDLSVIDPASLSGRRMSSILAGENLFVHQLGWIARMAHPIRLMLRAARFWNVQRAHSRRILEFVLLRK